MADIISQFRRVVYISDDGIELTTVGSLELLLRQVTCYLLISLRCTKIKPAVNCRLCWKCDINASFFAFWV
jgi:hypothetical protein